MIDINKTYRTRSGKRVIGLKYVPLNSNGEKVTYPIKGSIIVREKPFKARYQIWSEDGITDVVFKNYSKHPDDLFLDDQQIA